MLPLNFLIVDHKVKLIGGVGVGGEGLEKLSEEKDMIQTFYSVLA